MASPKQRLYACVFVPIMFIIMAGTFALPLGAPPGKVFWWCAIPSVVIMAACAFIEAFLPEDPGQM